MNKKTSLFLIIFGMAALSYQNALAQDEDLAKKLANPVSSLIM